MVFSSMTFLMGFLPVVLFVYYLSPKKIRNFILFAASLLFYAWGEPVYVVLMIFSTVVDYVHGILVDRFRGTGRAKWVVISSCIINLGLLGVFKYSGFLMESINGLLGLSLPVPALALPIGISFYTFQTMSYTIDVYRGDAPVQRNIISFGAYVALFPQLIAGPIVRYKDVAAQIDRRRENTVLFGDGAQRFVMGLGKKVLLANTVGAVFAEISAMDISSLPVVTAWIGAVCYGLQIYFDFSGYSDMAIGLGKMFGFTFVENFRYPYMSRSITEFWRRWHISLGTWFREYVYIPLGGNRRGLPIQLRNIAVVWLLTGFWHGAGWNFILWGVWYMVLLMAEKLFLSRWLQRLPAAVGHVYTLLCVLVGWVIFAFDSIGDGMSFLGAMMGAGGVFADGVTLFYLASFGGLMVLAAVAATPLPAKLGRMVTDHLQWAGDTGACVYMVSIYLLSLAFLVGGTYNPFLYFRF